MPRQFLTALFVLFIFGIQAQMTFHRGYPIRQGSLGNDPDTSIFNITGIELKDKNYLSLDGILPTNDSTFHHLVITKYKPKGDILWSKRIKFNDKNLRINPGFSSLIEGTNDSIYFSFSLFNQDFNNCIGAIDKNGENIWLKILNQPTAEENGQISLIIEGKDSLFYNISNINSSQENEILFTRLNAAGKQILTQRHNYFNNDGLAYIGLISESKVAEDSTFIFTGIVTSDATFPELLFGINNQDLTPLLHKVYTSPDAINFPIFNGTKVLKYGNEYIITAQYLDLNPFDILSSYLGSLILKVDNVGNVVWSKIIDGNISFINAINGVTIGSDNNIYVAGTIINNQTAFAPFMLSLKSDGTQNWLNIYDRAFANFTLLGNLFSTSDKGLGYFHTDIDNPILEIIKTSFIKTDLKGKTTCENISNLNLLVDINIDEDTVITSIDTVVTTFNDLPATLELFNTEYDIPILSPEAVFFCSNDTIDYTFRKDVPGAVKWKWDDGSTADSLRVFKEGQYSVTVTIDDKYCFELCDTNEIKLYALPTVEVNTGGKVCEGADFTIRSMSTVDKGPATIKWNTLETTPSISKNQLGTYTVTVTDGCGINTSKSVTVDESIWFGPPNVTIPAINKVCEGMPFIINVFGTSPAGGDISYKWESGETTPSIIKSQLGTYTVTVTDRCNKTSSASVNVTTAIYYGPPNAAVAMNGEKVCEGSDILLAASGTSQEPSAILTYKWSNNAQAATTSIVVVKELGIYAVTVTDACGKTDDASITINKEVFYKEAPEVELSNGVNDYCEKGDITLIAKASTPNASFSNFTFKWSNGQTTTSSGESSTVVSGIGEYKVTVSDICGNTKEAKKNIEDPSTIADECVKFPKIFFARDSAYENNTLFGPFSSCLTKDSLDIQELKISDYEFKVYNRWGKEVFSSTDPIKRWNGKLTDGDEEFYPADVYVWYASYKIGEFCELKRKGDVTFLR
jgi:hypothetical protein